MEKVWGPFYSFIWESNKGEVDDFFEELVKKCIDFSLSEFVLIESNDLIKTIKLDRSLTIDYTDEDKGCVEEDKKRLKMI